MKHLIRASFAPPLFLAAATAVPFLAYADSPNPAQANQILGFFLTLLGIVVEILLTLAIVVFGWGIVRMIAYAGNPQKIGEAKKALLWGFIGIFILASLYGIIKFIKDYTGITANPSIQVPKFTT